MRANIAETAPGDPDPRLRGRTYAISFERVWQAARTVAGTKMRRWRIVEEDDYEGIIRAEATTLVFRFVDDVQIRVFLDPDAQTRVDMYSASRKGVGDLGTNARRIGRFMHRLDRELEASR
jgi:uncharacterized protein (DUF1499 family)